MKKNASFENETQQMAFFKTLQEFLRLLLFSGIILVSVFLLLGLQEKKVLRLKCNAERVGKDLGLPAFVQKGHTFGGGKMQSREFAFTGDYSMRLDNLDPFGFQYELPYLKGNEKISASVWRYANGKNATTGILVASSKGFWKAGEEVIEKAENGWEKISFEFSPPSESRNHPFKIYCWNNGNSPIWFDDLEIEIRYEEPL